MIVLPFRNLPFTKTEILMSDADIAREIEQWAAGNIHFYSYGFLISKFNGQKTSDFAVPMGFIEEGRLVTSKDFVFNLTHQVYELSEKYEVSKESIRAHVGEYFLREGERPPWGDDQYFHLVDVRKKTPYVLEGPHKEGGLRPNEKRYVVKYEDTLVYGPRL